MPRPQAVSAKSRHLLARASRSNNGFGLGVSARYSIYQKPVWSVIFRSTVAQLFFLMPSLS